MTKFKALFACTALVATASLALADDNELYQAPPPDDAAFIRLLDAQPLETVFDVVIPGDEQTAYRPISSSLTDGATAGHYYAVAKNADGEFIVIEEPERADKSKVHLFLINLTNAPVRVELDGKDVQVIESTNANEAGVRAVNPVSAKLNVVTENGTVLGAFEVALRRGQNITFVARTDTAEVIENTFGTNIEG